MHCKLLNQATQSLLLLLSYRILPSRGQHEQPQSQERPQVGIDLYILVIGLLVSDEDPSIPILIVSVDGHGDLVEDIEQGYHLIPLVGSRVAQKNLQGCPHTVGLHLSEEPALLALYAIEDVTDIVDVLLVLLYLRIVPSEEFQGFFLLCTQVIPLQGAQQFREEAFCLQIGGDVVRLDGQVVPQVPCCLLHCLRQDAVDEEEVLDALGMIQHPTLVLGMIEVELRVALGGQIGPHCLPGRGCLVES